MSETSLEPRAADGSLPPERVRMMFDRIAGPYDRMNRVMTAGLDRRWRALAADEARRRPRRGRGSTSAAAPATSRSSWPGGSATRAR